MQWSQIKTLFILCFLVLDVYLLFLFIDKQKEADIGVIERQTAPIEQTLESENITIKELPEVPEDESFLSVKQKEFDEDDKKLLNQLTKQEVMIVDDNFIIAGLDKPVKIPDNITNDGLKELLKNIVLYPDEYEVWDTNEEYNAIVLFQRKNDRPVYFNRNGMLMLFLNEKNEIAFYTQTMLGEAEEHDQEDKKSLIKPIRAVETLYQSNQLNAGEEVTKIKIGYHTRIPLPDGVQVFVPTWKVTVNGERNYFVNAIEGFVFSSEDDKFVYDTIDKYLDRIFPLIQDDEAKKNLWNQLKNKLDTVNQGEE